MCKTNDQATKNGFSNGWNSDIGHCCVLKVSFRKCIYETKETLGSYVSALWKKFIFRNARCFRRCIYRSFPYMQLRSYNCFFFVLTS